jgi:hypothetical protein
MEKQTWSKEKIISEIQKRNKNHLSLTYKQVMENYKSLYSASVRYYGSWKKALSAAGLEYEGRSHRKWDRKKVIKEIRKRKKNGSSLSTFDIQKEDASLYLYAWKFFGSWKNAMKASGLRYDRPVPQKWSKDKVVNEIKKLKKKGEKVNHNYVYTYHRPLYSAGYRRFGNWRNTLKAAGLDPDNPNK